MSSYDQVIKVRSRYVAAAKAFFAFLDSVGRKYPRPTKIRYRYLKRGRFYVVVDGSPGGIDALFQELLLSRGLYYYACTLRGVEKRQLLRHAIIPIFQDLLDARFANPYGRFLHRQLSWAPIEQLQIPGNLAHPIAHEYEVLFARWGIGLLDDWDFTKDVDALLTKFLLTSIGHVSGSRSPRFATLLEIASIKGIGMAPETKESFDRFHRARTEALHRLDLGLSKEELTELGFAVFSYFQFFDEFDASQRRVTERLHGKRYRRIRYGSEKSWGLRERNDDPHAALSPCGDCFAAMGQFHCDGCDLEQCPRCLGQFLGCKCKLLRDYD